MDVRLIGDGLGPCTANQLAKETALGLGAQAGEARLRETAATAGLNGFRRVAETR